MKKASASLQELGPVDGSFDVDSSKGIVVPLQHPVHGGFAEWYSRNCIRTILSSELPIVGYVATTIYIASANLGSTIHGNSTVYGRIDKKTRFPEREPSTSLATRRILKAPG